MSFLGAQNSIALGVQGLIHIDTGGGAGGSADYLLAKSLRFRSSASAYLNRTFGTPTNNKKWTWSGWVKRGALGASETIFSSFQNGSNYFDFRFNTSDQLFVQNRVGAVNLLGTNTTAVYRDPSAWYHIMFVFDSDNATAANRNLLYVNGVSVAWLANSGSSDASNFNASGYEHDISGSQTAGLWALFDGEQAEINFVDGQALAPTSFGATGANSQWLPKAYTGPYGTNGFYLPFTNTTSTSTLVADSSGNANNWTPNNISLTGGSTYDSLTDVPTLTSTTVANYAVWNAVAAGIDSVIDNGNLRISYGSAATRTGTAATMGMTTGKFYWEVTVTGGSGSMAPVVGISNTTANSSVSSGIGYYPGYTASGWGYEGSTGDKYNNLVNTAYGATYTTNDVIGVAFDATAGSLTFYKNNVSQGVAFSSLPATTYFPAVGDGGSTGTVTYAGNFGQQPFVYPTLPTGFLPLNTYNIAAGTVTTSGTFTGNLSTDGPFVFLNGTPTAMTINGNAVTFGTHADKLANGFKVRSSSASYNASGSNTYVATTVGEVFKYEDAQGNP